MSVNMLSKRFRQHLCIASGIFCMLSSGIHYGWITQAIPSITSAESGMGIEQSETSLLSAIFSIGSPIGGLIGVLVGTKWSQKYLLILTSIIFIGGFLTYTFSKSLTIFVITRCVIGIGGGITYTIAYGYISEIVTKDIRGTVGFFATIALNLGLFLPMVIMPYISFTAANLLFMISPIIQLSLCLFALESPYLYLRRGDPVSAKKVLQQLRHTDCEKEFLEIQEYLKSIEHEKVGPMIFITNMVYRKALLFATLVIIAKKMAGTDAVVSYAVQIATPGKDLIDPDVSVILFGAAGLIMVVFSSYFVDKYGRKVLFVASGAIVTLGLLILSIYYYLDSKSFKQIESYRLAPVIAMIILNSGKGIGLSPLPYVYTNELMPNSVRTFGSCYITFIGGAFGFAVSSTFLPLQNNFGPASPFIIYGVSTIVCIVLMLIFLPETKGLSFMEIQNLLEGSRRQKDNVNKC